MTHSLCTERGEKVGVRMMVMSGFSRSLTRPQNDGWEKGGVEGQNDGTFTVIRYCVRISLTE